MSECSPSSVRTPTPSNFLLRLLRPLYLLRQREPASRRCVRKNRRSRFASTPPSPRPLAPVAKERRAARFLLALNLATCPPAVLARAVPRHIVRHLRVLLPHAVDRARAPRRLVRLVRRVLDPHLLASARARRCRRRDPPVRARASARMTMAK